jgi:hypothetical protein
VLKYSGVPLPVAGGLRPEKPFQKVFTYDYANLSKTLSTCVCVPFIINQTPAAVCVVYSVRDISNKPHVVEGWDENGTHTSTEFLGLYDLKGGTTPKALSSLKPQNHVVVKTFTSRSRRFKVCDEMKNKHVYQ